MIVFGFEVWVEVVCDKSRYVECVVDDGFFVGNECVFGLLFGLVVYGGKIVECGGSFFV